MHPNTRHKTFPIPMTVIEATKSEDITSVDDVLNRFGNRNRYLIFILILMSICWGIAAMPIMVNAFMDSPTMAKVLKNSTNCTKMGEIDQSRIYITDREQLLCNFEDLLHFQFGPSAKSYATLMFMTGIIAGSAVISPLSDRFGRRPGVIGTPLCLGIFGIIAAWMPNFYAFCVFRFLQGMCYLGGVAFNWVLAYECLPSETRAFSALVMGFCWVIGYCLVSPLAVVFTSWRTLLTAASTPALIYGGVCFFICPESLHFLVLKGDTKRVQVWLDKAAQFGKVQPGVDAEQLIRAVQRDRQGDESIFDGLKKMLTSKYHILLLAVLIYLWSCDVFVYYGLSLNSTAMQGDKYTVYFLSGFVELPAYVLSPFMLNRVGRKLTVSGGHLFSGFFLLLFLLIPKHRYDECLEQWFSNDYWANVATMCWLLGKFAISLTFVSLFAFSSELFPTSIRSVALGVCSFVSRMGGVFVPKTYYESGPLIVFCAAALIAGILVWLLPETNHRELPMRVDDVKKSETNK